jgi:translation initiation factor IF-2
MDIKRIPGSTLDRYLNLVKQPVDAVARRTRRAGQSTSPAELLLDRVDATVREAAGRILGDETLQDDARRRRTAASERERALELKAEAEVKTQNADQEFARRQRAADERRQSAERRADEEKQRIEQEKQAKERAVEQTAAQRKSANRKVASTVEGAIDDKADKNRLQQLQVESDALREEEEALAAAATAKTLSTAAGKAKATRKNGN